ncbi:argininosuccinate lyase [Alicyclobacillus cycloheptanicus]|uniref:Argininosuccinate lyase n=1 Tax=Alicyclobacillus cycloheptanicus TaxID=1457 RepID=A0ABT9XGY9_9BACL|nr:argininosuccinate lyase [Alicyclobacillus cycloheptanicus]MDQ0189553.1 argininosuccinate lyase [Alicyclobacillus cycloheptanicus]WDM01607.1 argininosuccinate lyase [Alicyclobacillus cycloheptanicus]
MTEQHAGKLWGGRFTEQTNDLVEAYTASIGFDERLATVDIRGSIAHARMLGRAGIIPEADAQAIVSGLEGLLVDLEAGQLSFRVEDEDIHMNIERLLSERIGAVAGKLHTGRSRNDQVALDMHLFVREATATVQEGIRKLQRALVQAAEANLDVLIPGYTHLQRAQPVLLAHHLLAYFWMLERDYGRFSDTAKRTDMMPLGAGALAGTTFPINREAVMEELGFSALYENSLDAVSDRDYLIEFLSASSLLMTHLSRFSEELILWSSEEFGFVEIADAYCTGSSMMPQKKNPDVPELVRGKTGRVFGHLMGLLTVLKGLPLAYNKDLQEDKEGVFDTLDTIVPALELFAGMVETLQFRRERLQHAFDHDFSNATDVADYLAGKGVPFRAAHEIVGKLVLQAIEAGTNLAGLPFQTYQDASAAFAPDIYERIAPGAVVAARASRGGTAPEAVTLQLNLAKARLSL